MAQQDVFQTFVKKGQTAATFQLVNTDVAFANTLRRLVLTGVETVAFRSDINELGQTTDVKIIKNTTSMTNEMLADRVGLLPLVVKDPLAWNPDTYTFKLSLTNTSSDLLDVKASDFVVTQKTGANGEETAVPNTEFFHPDPITKDTILLAVLKGARGSDSGAEVANEGSVKRQASAAAGDTIEIEARATVGTGREHARFIPVSQCAYKYTLDSSEERQNELFESWLKNSKKILDMKTLDSSSRDSFKREYMTMEIDRCYVTDPDTNEPNSFDFTMETIGTMGIEAILMRALQKAVLMCAPYTNLESQALPSDMRVQPAANRLEGYDFIFQKHDHTLGNLLTSYIDIYLLDDVKVTYVSYCIPHPLRDEMLLRIGVAGGKEVDARKVVSEAARGCATMFSAWQESLKRQLGQAGPATAPGTTAPGTTAPGTTVMQPTTVIRGPKVKLTTVKKKPAIA
jgi:DNA-directed RNA polymerase subunit L